MIKQNTNDFFANVSDVQGRLTNIPSLNPDEINNLAKKIWGEAVTSKKNTPNKKWYLDAHPNYSESSIEEFNFFRKNIYEPKRVLYPCSYIDASPIKGFPNSEVILIDKDKDVSRVMKRHNIKNFIQGDVLKYNPENPFDLVIILNPQLESSDLTKHLSDKGYVLANNWHNNASQLLENSDFENIGTIDKNENGLYLTKNFDKLKPNQFDTYLYVFRRKG